LCNPSFLILINPARKEWFCWRI